MDATSAECVLPTSRGFSLPVCPKTVNNCPATETEWSPRRFTVKWWWRHKCVWTDFDPGTVVGVWRLKTTNCQKNRSNIQLRAINGACKKRPHYLEDGRLVLCFLLGGDCVDQCRRSQVLSPSRVFLSCSGQQQIGEAIFRQIILCSVSCLLAM